MNLFDRMQVLAATLAVSILIFYAIPIEERYQMPLLLIGLVFGAVGFIIFDIITDLLLIVGIVLFAGSWNESNGRDALEARRFFRDEEGKAGTFKLVLLGIAVAFWPIWVVLSLIGLIGFGVWWICQYQETEAEKLRSMPK